MIKPVFSSVLLLWVFAAIPVGAYAMEEAVKAEDCEFTPGPATVEAGDMDSKACILAGDFCSLSSDLMVATGTEGIPHGSNAGQEVSTTSLQWTGPMRIAFQEGIDGEAASGAPANGKAGKDGAKVDDWKFTFSPYLWAVSLQGNATIGGTRTDVDLDFNDIWDDLNVAAMGDFRAEKGPWAINTNFLYADLESDEKNRLTKLDLEPQLWIITLDGRYRLWKNLELLAGVRYYDISIDIDLKAFGVKVYSDRADENWIDPIVGAAYTLPLSEKWSLHANGDIGGFGVGSDFAWNVQSFMICQLSKKTSILFGYRHLDWDYTDGHGSSKVELDLYLTGFMAGVSFDF